MITTNTLTYFDEKDNCPKFQIYCNYFGSLIINWNWFSTFLYLFFILVIGREVHNSFSVELSN